MPLINSFPWTSARRVLLPLPVDDAPPPSRDQTETQAGGENEYGMWAGARVLLVNGTFIRPVPVSPLQDCLSQNVCVGETPAQPPAPCDSHTVCDFLYTGLFARPYDFFFASRYTRYILTFSSPCNFLSLSLFVCVCVCVQTLAAGCSCLVSSSITSSRASRSLKWAEWSKPTSWWRPRLRRRTGTPARWASDWSNNKFGIYQIHRKYLGGFLCMFRDSFGVLPTTLWLESTPRKKNLCFSISVCRKNN